MDSGRGHRVTALWKLNMNQLIKLEAAKAASPVCLCLLGLSGSFWVFLDPSRSFYDLLGCFRIQNIPSITNPK